jgi:adenylate kinase family enzyme
MFYGVINEGYIFDSKDIKYQVEEFEQGKVKALFVTGQSGSGKSTLAHKYEKELGINCYELDDINYNYKFTDEQLKEYGKELCDFLTGPGKKYRITEEQAKRLDQENESMEKTLGWKADELCGAFIKYLLSKNTRCIVEGVNIFFALKSGYLKPEDFKNSAVIIKGTSMVKSMKRAWDRDFGKDTPEDYKLKGAKETFEVFVARLKFALQSESALKKVRKQYNKKDKK